MQWTRSLKTRAGCGAEDPPGELMCENGKTAYLQSSWRWGVRTPLHQMNRKSSKVELEAAEP